MLNEYLDAKYALMERAIEINNMLADMSDNVSDAVADYLPRRIGTYTEYLKLDVTLTDVELTQTDCDGDETWEIHRSYFDMTDDEIKQQHIRSIEDMLTSRKLRTEQLNLNRLHDLAHQLGYNLTKKVDA